MEIVKLPTIGYGSNKKHMKTIEMLTTLTIEKDLPGDSTRSNEVSYILM